MLENRSVLIVEEEYLITLDIRQILEDAGADNFSTALNATEALRMGKNLAAHALAIIEMPINDPDAVMLYEQLRRYGVPIVVSSADGGFRRALPDGIAAPVVIKPFSSDDLLGACETALGSA